MFHNPKIKKLILGLFLSCFILGNFLVIADKAEAQVGIVHDPNLLMNYHLWQSEWMGYWTGVEAEKKAEEKAKSIFESATKLAIKNTLKTFTRKFAMDLANHLAKKAAGKESSFFEEGFGNYMKNMADASAGVFLESLSAANGFSLNGLCHPGPISWAIMLGLQEYAYPSPPVCKLTDYYKNWKKFVTADNFTDQFLKPYFSPKENQLGIALTSQLKLIEFIDEKQQEALLKRWPEKTLRNLDDPLTKKIRTPSRFLSDYVSLSQTQGLREVSQWIGDPLADSIDAFGNTFLIQYLGLLYKGYLKPNDPGGLGAYSGSGIGGRTAEATKEYYTSFIGTPQFKSPGEIDVFKLIACPEDPSLAQQSNCVVDQQFFQAIREEMTVQQALDANPPLLHEGYLFGYKDPVSGIQVEQPDLDNGYSVDNMKKLRSMRILPVGWELAAEVVKNEVRSPTTLGEVVAGFDKYGEDGICGTDDDGESKFCNLVDPNWVLKAPRQRCDVKAYGAATLADSNVREEICVDTKTCLREDEKGACLAWGYCDRERNIWRFGGTECPSYYNSCENFIAEDGGEVSYLENTIDKGICNASNSGCSWYCDMADTNSLWSCTANDSDLGLENNKKIFFNKDVLSCDKQEAGCTELIKPAVDSGVNLLVNGSFEEFDGQADDGESDRVLGWVPWLNMFVLETVTESAPNLGNYAAKVGSPLSGFPDSILTQYVGRLRAGVPYIMSSSFKADTDVNVSFEVLLGQEGEGGSFTSSEIKIGPVFGTGGWQYINFEKPFILTANSDVKFLVKVSGGEALIDGLKLEEATEVTSYIDYGSTNLTYIKKAPDYLECDINPDNPLCYNYTPYCSADEVGCELFTPTNGDPGVPGIITSDDLCPESCVGYDMFIQEQTPFEIPNKPAYFIPEKANGCTEVGCEQFTNLDTEQVEYFSEMRFCEKPDGEIPVFYTWEGSDEAGYQLKVWNLAEDSSSAPACAGGGSVCDCTGEYGVSPDCRQFYDVEGGIHYRYYSQTITITEDCNFYRQTSKESIRGCDDDDDSTPCICEDLGGEFDVNTRSCIYHGYPEESIACSATENGCREYKGNYAENVANIFNDDFETGTTGDWGGEAGTLPTFSNESLSVGGHSLAVLNPSDTYLAKNITDEVTVNKVYSLSFWAKGAGEVNVGFGDKDGNIFNTANNLAKFKTIELKPDWRLYNLGTAIVANSDDDVFLIINQLQSNQDYYFDNIILKEVQERLLIIKDSWIVPLECDQDNSGNILPLAQLGCQAYFDRNNVSYPLKSFDKLCRERAVGCTEFIDTKNSDAGYNEVKNAVCWRSSSTNLNSEVPCYRVVDGEDINVCTIEAGQVYCRYDIADLYDPYDGLRNSDICSLSSTCASLNGCLCSDSCWVNKGEKTCLPKGDAATVVVPHDEFIYLVEAEKYTCNSQSKGCKEVGQPSIDVNNQIVEWGVTYLRDLPDTYNTTLCEPRALNCKEYRSEDKLLYFKDPKAKLCDYRVEENVGGSINTGWFKKDSQEPCFDNYEILKNADARYDGWAGLCEAQYSSCEEFIDPAGTTPSHPEGKPYYYLDNEELDRSSCNGQVSLTEGCVLFNQTSNPNIYWNAPLSYLESEKNGNKLVNPLTLSQASAVKYCFGVGTKNVLDEAYPCSNDNDCPSNSTCQDFTYQPGLPSLYCRYNRNTSGIAVVNITLSGYVWGDTCMSNNDCGEGGKCLNREKFLEKRATTNAILKVKRDRECAEWIDCIVGERIKDPTKGNEYRNVCYDIGRCLELDENTGACAEPAPSSCVHNNDCLAGQECVSKKCSYPTLTKKLYQERELKWSLVKEYSGFAIPNMRSVDGLKEVTGVPKEPYSEDRSGKKGYCSSGGSAKIGIPCDNNNECGGTYEEMSISGQCEIQHYLANYNDSVMEVSATGFSELNSSRQYLKGDDSDRQHVLIKSCRSYPEANSPFKPSTYSDPDRPTCAEDSYGLKMTGLTFNTCDCTYQEVKAGGKTIYYPSGFQIPSYVCSSSGQACDPHNEEVSCPGSEECVKVKDNTIKLGWKGYCLEPDNKKPDRCLTWYPIDVVEGEMNLFTYNPAATYVHSGPEYYCMEGMIDPDRAGTCATSDLILESQCNTKCNDLSAEDLCAKIEKGEEEEGFYDLLWDALSINANMYSDYVTFDYGSSHASCYFDLNFLDIIESSAPLCTELCSHSGPRNHWAPCEAIDSGFDGFVWRYATDPWNVKSNSIPAGCIMDDGEYWDKGDDRSSINYAIKDDLWRLDRESMTGKWFDKPSGLVGLYIIHHDEGPGKLTYLYEEAEETPLFQEQIDKIFIYLNTQRDSWGYEFPPTTCGELLDCVGGEGKYAKMCGDQKSCYEVSRENFKANAGDCWGFWSDGSDEEASFTDTLELHRDNDWFIEKSNDQGSLRVSAQFGNDSKFKSITIDGNDQGDEGAFVIVGYEIKFKDEGCKILARVAKNGRNYAFTNDINIHGYLSDTSAASSSAWKKKIDYLSNWQPWGGTNAYTGLMHDEEHPPLKTYIINKTDQKCEYCGAIYRDIKYSGEPTNSLLTYLFARVFEQWKFDEASFAYNDPVKNDDTFIGKDTIRNIGRPKISGIKVNDKESGTINVNEFGKVNLSFYMYDSTARGQLPIRYVKVDWGDENEQEITSSFGNYGDSAEFICNSTDWGREGERCVNEPLEFFHIYRARDVVDGDLCEEDPNNNNCRICEIEISARDNLAEIKEERGEEATRTKVASTTVRVCKKSK